MGAWFDVASIEIGLPLAPTTFFGAELDDNERDGGADLTAVDLPDEAAVGMAFCVVQAERGDFGELGRPSPFFISGPAAFEAGVIVPSLCPAGSGNESTADGIVS